MLSFCLLLSAAFKVLIVGIWTYLSCLVFCAFFHVNWNRNHQMYCMQGYKFIISCPLVKVWLCIKDSVLQEIY